VKDILKNKIKDLKAKTPKDPNTLFISKHVRKGVVGGISSGSKPLLIIDDTKQ